MILKDIIKKFDKSNIKAGDGLERGVYPLYTCSPIVNKYLNDYLYEDEALIISTGGNFSIHYVNGKFNYSTDCYVFNTDKYNLKYLYYYLLSKRNDINKMFRGAGLKHLNKNEFIMLNIKDISLNEQCDVVNQLDKINEMIGLREKQIEMCNNLIKSQFVEMFGDPIMNDKNYKLVKIEKIALNVKNSIKAGPFGSSLKKEYYVSSGYKVYGQEQVIADDVKLGDYYIDDNKYKELISCEVKENDILISLVGTYGKVLVIPKEYEKGIINPRLMKISPNTDIINPYFFKLLFGFMSSVANNNTHGGIMGILNVGIVKNMNIILPSIGEQNNYMKIVEQIDKQKFVGTKIARLLVKIAILW